jgi:hypothetical protein
MSVNRPVSRALTTRTLTYARMRFSNARELTRKYETKLTDSEQGRVPNGIHAANVSKGRMKWRELRSAARSGQTKSF